MSSSHSISTSSSSKALISTTSQSIHAHSHKSPRKILSEEDYTTKLQSIISRDYYPSLPTLRRDVAILQARSEGDTTKAVAIRRAARQIELAEEELQSNSKKNSLENANVDTFHRLVTSEDNEHFEQVQKEEVLQHRAFVNQVFESALSTKHLIKHQIQDEDNLNGQADDALKLLASDEFNSTPKRAKNNHQKDISKSSLFFTPLHQKQVGSSLILPGVNDHLIKNNNTNLLAKDEDRLLMPPPSSMTSPSNRKQTSSIKMQLNRENGNNDREKRIQPSETRFPYQTASRIMTRPTSFSTEISHLPLNESSTEYDSTTTNTDLDSSPQSLHQERLDRQSKLMKDHQTYVNLTPVILPGKRIIGMEEEEEEPIMTWGDVASTPLMAPNPPPVSIDTREQIAQTLVRKNQQKQRNLKPLKKNNKPDSKNASLLDRTQNLTPAAKSLLRSHVSSSTPISSFLSKSKSNQHHKINARNRSAFGSALRDSYSVSRSSSFITSKSRIKSCQSRNSSAMGATPRIHRNRTKESQISKENKGKRNDSMRINDLLEM